MHQDSSSQTLGANKCIQLSSIHNLVLAFKQLTIRQSSKTKTHIQKI